MRRRDLVMAVLTGLFVTMFALVLVGALQPLDGLLLAVFYVGLFLLVTAVTYRKRGRPDRETAGRSVWDVIPSWQYTGRHVESGGITRDGQERAIQEIQERADAEDPGQP